MSHKLKHLTGRDVLKALTAIGFEVVSTRERHAKLRRALPNGEMQVLTIPIRRELDLRTVRAIFRPASRFGSEEELRHWFFTH